MMTVSSVNPKQVHSEALKFIVVHGIVEDCILGLDALYEHRCFPSVFAVSRWSVLVFSAVAEKNAGPCLCPI